MSGVPGDPLEGLPFARSRAVETFAELMFGPKRLEDLAKQARGETRKNFGRTMRLFAPLYLSNECVNSCQYCGFSKENPIRRVTLTPDEVESEAKYLAGQGFRNLLLVSGEHPREVPVSYLAQAVKRTVGLFPSVAIEVAPLATAEYREIVAAGAEGLVLYQESYDRAAYAEMHVSGPKRNFDERLGGPERGYAAGFRRIGLGVLVGLADWRRELVALAAHVSHMMKVGWRSQITLGFAEVEAGGGGVSAESGDVGSGFCPGDLCFSHRVSPSGHCFIDPRAGEVAGWIDGVGGDDDECGFGDGSRGLHGCGEGAFASDGAGAGGGPGGRGVGGGGGDGAV